MMRHICTVYSFEVFTSATNFYYEERPEWKHPSMDYFNLTTHITLAYDETVPALYESLDNEEFSLTVKLPRKQEEEEDSFVVYSFNQTYCSCSAGPNPFEEKTCAPGNMIAKTYLNNMQQPIMIYADNDQVDTKSFSHDTRIQIVATPLVESSNNECLYVSLTTLTYSAAHDPNTRVNATSGVDNIVTFLNTKSKVDDRSVLAIPAQCKSVQCSGIDMMAMNKKNKKQ